MWGKTRAALLFVAEFRVVRARRLFSTVLSFSIVISIPTRMGFKARSNSLSVSVKAKRTA